MSLSLYMDVHVPRAIARSLIADGVDVITAQEDGCARMPDPELLDRASCLAASCFRGMKTCLPKRFGDNVHQFRLRV